MKQIMTLFGLGLSSAVFAGSLDSTLKGETTVIVYDAKDAAEKAKAEAACKLSKESYKTIISDPSQLAEKQDLTVCLATVGVNKNGKDLLSLSAEAKEVHRLADRSMENAGRVLDLLYFAHFDRCRDLGGVFKIIPDPELLARDQCVTKSDIACTYGGTTRKLYDVARVSKVTAIESAVHAQAGMFYSYDDQGQWLPTYTISSIRRYRVKCEFIDRSGSSSSSGAGSGSSSGGSGSQ